MPSLVAQRPPSGDFTERAEQTRRDRAPEGAIQCAGLYTRVTYMEAVMPRESMSHGLKEKGQMAAPSAHQGSALS